MITLEVYYEGKLYAYDSEIEDGRIAFVQRTRDRNVEMGEVQLQVDSTTFAGVSNRFAITYDVEGIRARVKTTIESDTLVVIDGIILPGGITHDPIADTWSLTILDGSNDEFQKKLDALAVTSGGSIAITTEVLQEAPTQRADGLNPTTIQEDTRKWHNLWDAWEATVAQDPDIQVSYPGFDHDGFVVDVGYSSGGDGLITQAANLYVCEPYASNNYAPDDDLPIWTGAKIFELLSIMLGWKYTSRYANFPGRTIVVSIIGDLWRTGRTALFTLDSLIARQSEKSYPKVIFGIEEPEMPDFAVQYQNKVGEPGMLRRLTSEAVGTGAFPPDDMAVYATPAGRWNLDADGSGQNEDLVAIPVYVAHLKTLTEGGIVTPDPVNHPNYDERITTGTPIVKEGAVWICEGEASTPALIAYHTPVNPRSGFPQRMGAHYATQLYYNYQLARVALYTAMLDVDLDGVIGTTFPGVTEPVSLLSEEWEIREISIEPETLVAAIQAIRPASAFTSAEVVPELSVPRNFSACVQNCLYPAQPWLGGAQSIDILLNWDAPTIGTPVEYRLEYWREGVDSDWKAFTPATIAHPTTQYLDTAASDIDASGNFDIVRYRVRAEDAVNETAWVYANMDWCF